MTVNDQNSIYVGGLAYDVSEELMRKTFDEFGEIVAVKIVQDQDGQSKGYGFITFTASEAASSAILGMNGRVMAGRTIKVNEVRNRGSKTMSYRDRGRDRDRDRDRSRDRDRRDRDRDSRMSRDRERNGRGRYSPRRRRSPYRSARDRSPVYRRSRNDRSRSPSASADSRDSYDRYDRSERTKTSKETAADSRLKEDLAKAIECQQDRRDQVSALEIDLERAYQTIEDMRNKEKKLETSLANAVAASFQRAEFLRKVQRAFIEFRDCKDKLKNAEIEFEAMMESSIDVENLENGLKNDRHASHANGDIKFGEEPKS